MRRHRVVRDFGNELLHRLYSALPTGNHVHSGPFRNLETLGIIWLNGHAHDLSGSYGLAANYEHRNLGTIEQSMLPCHMNQYGVLVIWKKTDGLGNMLNAWTGSIICIETCHIMPQHVTSCHITSHHIIIYCCDLVPRAIYPALDKPIFYKGNPQC